MDSIISTRLPFLNRLCEHPHQSAKRHLRTNTVSYYLADYSQRCSCKWLYWHSTDSSTLYFLYDKECYLASLFSVWQMKKRIDQWFTKDYCVHHWSQNLTQHLYECEAFLIFFAEKTYSARIYNSNLNFEYGCMVCYLLLEIVYIYTCVIFSLLAFGFNGASVNRTGCSSGATRSSL